ncbi:MAG: amidohydrolase [Clostridia bacterium]|nr:amidohydrolase [Lachnospiraceae bacterium]NCB99335.1 amidohydrolase [Clostridia bacterium]NCD01562.1 amidohydrolase [Clostridia bacterium]
MVKECFADIVIMHGNVITVNSSDDLAEAVAISENKIICVGSNEAVKDYIGEKTQVIDAAGKTVMPGFIDAHIHFIMYGMLGTTTINVDYNHVDSIKDIQNLIREKAKEKKPGEWIVLSGYDHNKLAERRHPTIEDFDEAAPDNPVQCIRCCAHMAVYNSAAFKALGGIKPEDYAPGEVVVVADGKLTGLMKETAHMSCSEKVAFSEADLLAGLKTANEKMLAYGVTTVHDAGSYGAPVMRMFQEAEARKLIDVRVVPMIFDMFGKESGKQYIETFLKTGLFTGMGDEHFKLGPIKIMTDGSTSGPSCATREPYSHDPELKGLQVWQQDETDEMVSRVHRAGFQMTAHAVGDKAVEMMISAYEKALAECPRDNHRHRIEHCALTDEKLIERIQKLGIVPISNPAFISINGGDYNRFYEERVNYMFPLKSYVEKGIKTAIGSDATVTDPNPMFSIYGAVTRKDMKKQELCGENQKVSVEEIIRMFTYNGAYVTGEEELKGSLEVGKLADIILLSEDILKTDPENYMDVTVEMTMVDGKIVYTK